MNNWQPIETAPKDGTKILVAFLAEDKYRVALVHWADEDLFDEEGWDFGLTTEYNKCVHYWQPIPEPPEVQK
jgi:hypothetical protein